MSALQFVLVDENGYHQYVIDPVETFKETGTNWIIDNGWDVYEVPKEEYANCKPFISLVPQDDHPLYKMREHLNKIGSTVQVIFGGEE